MIHMKPLSQTRNIDIKQTWSKTKNQETSHYTNSNICWKSSTCSVIKHRCNKKIHGICFEIKRWNICVHIWEQDLVSYLGTLCRTEEHNLNKLQNFEYLCIYSTQFKLMGIHSTQQTYLAVNDRLPQFSYVEQQSTGIFHHIFDSSEEEDGLSPIDQPMVIRQCDVHHWSRNYVSSHHHRTAHYWVHSQDSRLNISIKGETPINNVKVYAINTNREMCVWPSTMAGMIHIAEPTGKMFF